MELGTRIRRSRMKAGLSIRGLARHLGVAPATVGHWETGKHSPSLHSLLYVAKITGAMPTWLLTGQTEADSQGCFELSPEDTGRVTGGLTPSVLFAILATPENPVLTCSDRSS